MAKLYWRVKRNGKWTWRTAIYDEVSGKVIQVPPEVSPLERGEEEWQDFGIVEGYTNVENAGKSIWLYQATVLVHGVIKHGDEMETLWMLRAVAWSWSTKKTGFTSKAWERWAYPWVHSSHAKKRKLEEGQDPLYYLHGRAWPSGGPSNRQIILTSMR